MPPRALFAAAALTAVAVFALVLVLIWQPWESDDSGDGASASDEPRMTLEGVIALVSAEHVGCPQQPALVLSADVVYDGEGKWTVTYRDYAWEVDEEDESVRTLGDAVAVSGAVKFANRWWDSRCGCGHSARRCGCARTAGLRGGRGM